VRRIGHAERLTPGGQPTEDESKEFLAKVASLTLECVRCSTRIDVTKSGVVHRTQVCAQLRPRQYGEEPPVDLNRTKEK
jgi:hypothetical protein